MEGIGKSHRPSLFLVGVVGYLRSVLLSLLWLHIGSHLEKSEKSGVWTFTHPPGGEHDIVVAALCKM